MRQNRLARILGVDESIVSKIVNGFREPSPELRGKIAALLHAEEAWLFLDAAPPSAAAPVSDGPDQTPEEQ